MITGSTPFISTCLLNHYTNDTLSKLYWSVQTLIMEDGFWVTWRSAYALSCVQTVNQSLNILPVTCSNVVRKLSIKVCTSYRMLYSCCVQAVNQKGRPCHDLLQVLIMSLASRQSKSARGMVHAFMLRTSCQSECVHGMLWSVLYACVQALIIISNYFQLNSPLPCYNVVLLSVNVAWCGGLMAHDA